MKWTELLRKDNYALLQSESDTQYAVVSDYDPTQPENQQWSSGIYFTYFQNNPKKILYLQSAYDCFMEKINADYIPRCRLEELATLFKDGLISDNRESAMEYFNEVCEMTDEEKEWFGIEEDSLIANSKFENPMYNKGYDDGFADGANSVETEMARTNFDIIRGLMIADNTLDSWICETEAEEKRDLTAKEENAYIQNIMDICEEIMQGLSCTLVEAYKEISE